MGRLGGWLIAGAAVISSVGCLNGWTLIVGQFPQAIAKDGLFPRLFARESAQGTPAAGLVVAAVIASILVLTNYTHGMVAMFTFMLLLTTLTYVVAYLFCSMADIVLAHRRGAPAPWRHLAMACGAFAFSLWAAIGAGQDTVYWTFMLLIVGIPLCVWQTRHTQGGATATQR